MALDSFLPQSEKCGTEKVKSVLHCTRSLCVASVDCGSSSSNNSWHRQLQTMIYRISWRWSSPS